MTAYTTNLICHDKIFKDNGGLTIFKNKLWGFSRAEQRAAVKAEQHPKTL